MNFLLNVVADKVSGDSTPEYEITIADNIRIIFEEYGTELWLMFFFGVIAGIVLSALYSFIKRVLFAEKENKNTDEDKEQ